MSNIAEHIKRLASIKEAKRKGRVPPQHNDPEFWYKMELVLTGHRLQPEPRELPLRHVHTSVKKRTTQNDTRPTLHPPTQYGNPDG